MALVTKAMAELSDVAEKDADDPAVKTEVVTQLAELRARLRQRGYEIVFEDEPGKTTRSSSFTVKKITKDVEDAAKPADKRKPRRST